MLTSKKVEVLQEGVTPHKCGNDWVMDFNSDTLEEIIEYKQICKVCGRVEKVTEQHETATFSDIYNKFHGGVSNA